MSERGATTLKRDAVNPTRGRGSVLKGRPRGDEIRPLTACFTRAHQHDRNPLGLHPVAVREMDGTRVKIGSIEVFDASLVVDIQSASIRADE
ncbi:MAG: hypothetical protein ACR2II_08605 [Chthoniobacterales bacterium]